MMQSTTLWGLNTMGSDLEVLTTGSLGSPQSAVRGAGLASREVALLGVACAARGERTDALRVAARAERMAVFASTSTEIEAHLLVASLRAAGIPALVDVSNPIVQDMGFTPPTCSVWVPVSWHEYARQILGQRAPFKGSAELSQEFREALVREIQESYVLLFVGVLLFPIGLVSGPMACRGGSRALSSYYQSDLDDQELERRIERLQGRAMAYTALYYGASIWLFSQLR